MEQTDPKIRGRRNTDYAAAYLQYQRYGRGRSMRRFCEDEGYDYDNFYRYSRKNDQVQPSCETRGTFVEITPVPDPAPKPVVLTIRQDTTYKLEEIRIRFTNGLVLSRHGGSMSDVDDLMSMARKLIG